MARASLSGYCEQGGQTVATQGLVSSTKVQQSYPQCTVTVYYTGGPSGTVTTNGTAVTFSYGTLFNANSGWAGLTITINSVAHTISSVNSTTSITLADSAGVQSTPVAYSMASTAPAAIFSDNSGTPKSNPFTASTTGLWLFYPNDGVYDVKLSGGGIPSPFTLSALPSIDPLVSAPYLVDSGYSTYAAACAAALATNRTLMHTKNWNIPSGTYTCSRQFVSGGKLTVNSSATATLSGSIMATETQQIFDTSASGASVVITNADTVYPEWWGGMPSNSSLDISTALQAAITATAASGGTVRFPQPSKYWYKNISTGSNITIECAAGAELHMPSGYGINDFLFSNNVIGATNTNINIGAGCLFQGDRASYSGGAGDGNNVALLLDGASNVQIHGTYDGWHTDAIFLGCQGGSSGSVPGDNIVIASDVKAINSRRNNISIVCGTNVRLDNPYLSYAGSTVGQVGTAPFSNIDIEPDSATNIVRGVTGSFTSVNPVGSHLQVVEQFVASTDLGIDVSCACTGSGAHGVLVTDFGTAHAISGVTIKGTFSGNGTSGPGYSAIQFAGTVTASKISAVINETNTGTMAIMMYGDNNSIGDGYYGGATYDMLVDVGATGNQISTGAVLKAGTFNPSGTGVLTAVVPGSLTVSGTLNMNSNTITAGTLSGTKYLWSQGMFGAGLVPSITPTPAPFQTQAIGANNTLMRLYAPADLTKYWEARESFGITNTDLCWTPTSGVSILCLRTYGAALPTLPAYANNAAALGGGLVAGDLYRSTDAVNVVH